MTTPQLAKRILDAMADLHMNQTQLAQALGISEARISDWKKGKSEPTGKQLVALAKILGVSVDYIVGLSDAPRGGEQREAVDFELIRDIVIQRGLTTRQAVLLLTREMPGQQ